MTNPSTRLARLMAGASFTLLAAVSGQALAADAGAADTATAATPGPEVADFGNRVNELVVTASRAVVAAPSKASLSATQPQSVITHDAIDQFTPVTADYTQIINLTPSISGQAFNGPGLSETKTTLRGFQDGEYNVTYDGIPWGDANGPTHHSNSFFPASTIGGVIVDRGPGTAGSLGAATFGGSVNLFSPEVSHQFGGSQQLSAGSWATYAAVTKINTGDIKDLNDARFLINLDERKTDGYLSHSGVTANNQMFRGIIPIVKSWQLTLFASQNYNKSYINDNNGATLTQVALYGKNFGLSGDPASPAYYGYNIVTKHTYFDYARLNGDINDKISVEDTVYIYHYKNDTESSVDMTLSPADIAAKNGLQSFPTPGSKAVVNGHVPGYLKLNQYYIYGNIAKADWTLPFGTLKPGIWWEHADTHRLRGDYDATLGRTVPDYRQKALLNIPQNVEYNQSSGWDQYQPFLDFEWRPLENLTVTPGIKYVNWKLEVDSPVNQKSRQPYYGTQTFEKTLYYATVNYKIRPDFAVYGQYATGFLIPDISATQVNNPNLSGLQPQTSTNYQAGAVYHGDKIQADADVYYIEFKNKIGTINNTKTGETDYVNQGGVTYKGVEGQASYAFGNGLSLFGNASLNSAKVNLTHKQVPQAPVGTAALGALYRQGPWSVSLVDKYTGQAWAVAGEPDAYKIPAYHQVDLSVFYTIGRVRLEGAVYNLTNSQQVTNIKPASKVIYDQYYYQPEANYQVSLKYSF